MQIIRAVHGKCGEARVLLWDIDGTLLSKSQDFQDSMHLSALGLNPDLKTRGEFHGLSDWDVLKSYSIKYGIEKAEALKAFRALSKSVEESSETRFVKNVGVEEALVKAKSLGWCNAILTGNTFSRATYKLRSTGLLEYFHKDLFFCCESGESRQDIAKRARLKLSSHSKSIVVIGDTQHDIIVAKNNEFRVISLVTGTYSREFLESYNPDLLLEDLELGYATFVDYLISLKN